MVERRLNKTKRGSKEDGFGWANPRKIPKTEHLIEFSNEAGDHAIAHARNAREARRMEQIARENGLEVDRDENLSRSYGAARQADRRDPFQGRFRTGRTHDYDEREPEEDADYSDWERDEQVATGRWLHPDEMKGDAEDQPRRINQQPRRSRRRLK